MKIEVVVSASPELSELIGRLVASLQKFASPAQVAAVAAPPAVIAARHPVPAAPKPAPIVPPIAVPPPPPLPAKPGANPDKFSDARLKMAAGMYGAGQTFATIILAVNRLPGPPWDEKAALNQRMRGGWQRIPQPAVDPVSASPPAPPPLRGGPPIFMDPDGKVPADFDQIVTWAGQRGIVFDGGNLDLVNRRRAGLGMKPFVCVPTRDLRRA